MMKMDRLRMCQKNKFCEETKMKRYRKYKSLLNSDDRDVMKRKYQHHKKRFRSFEKEYNDLKREMNYESEGDSTDSSAEGEEINETGAGGEAAVVESGKKAEWDGKGAC